MLCKNITNIRQEELSCNGEKRFYSIFSLFLLRTEDLKKPLTKLVRGFSKKYIHLYLLGWMGSLALGSENHPAAENIQAQISIQQPHRLTKIDDKKKASRSFLIRRQDIQQEAAKLLCTCPISHDRTSNPVSAPLHERGSCHRSSLCFRGTSCTA